MLGELRRLVVLAAVGALALPGAASAIADPQQEIGGAGSKWFSGSLIQQFGLNCSVLGSSYSEVMVSGVGSYGGMQGVVRVNDAYWVSLLVAIPGNPCGSGSSSVATDLKMPKNTSYDSSRQIRCFGTTRADPNNFFDITNETWNFLGHSGRYCPTGPGSSAGGIGQGYGFRPLANGQFFWMFVPVKSTGPINGAGEPGETGQFNWLTYASAAYASPDRSYIWANVFPAGGSGASTPYVYFAREPAAVPFWKDDAATGQENRVEFFANLYSAGFPGNLCFEIRARDNNAYIADCMLLVPSGAWDGTVPGGGSLFQVFGTGAALGPNGGYVPFSYEESLGEWDRPMKITWTFSYTEGSTPKQVSNSANFRTLAGPNDNDQCGNLPPPLPPECEPPPIPDVKGSANVKRGQKLKRAKLATGLPLTLACNVLSNAAAKLTLSRKVARSVGLPASKPIATGKGSCTPAAGGKLKLKLNRTAARKLRGKKVPAKLTITFTRSGSPAFKFVRPVRVV